jgi:quercetin dioxygenase-like cupin family protein
LNAIKIQRAVRIPVLALVLVGAVAGTALATTSTGFSGQLLSRGTVSHGFHVRADGIKLKTHDPMDIITQQVTIAPSGTSGWHTHPGIVLVTVFAGTVTFYNEHCKATAYPAGSSFVESGDDPGLARNESTTSPVTVFATYLEPVGTTVLRIDSPNPGCSQN